VRWYLAKPAIRILVQLRNLGHDPLTGETLDYQVPGDWGFEQVVAWFADFQEKVTDRYPEFIETPDGGFLRPSAVERADLRLTFVAEPC
jgi:hypothetical protein